MTNVKFQMGGKKIASGFTLVELMVSIGILTILFALTTINIGRLPSSASQSSGYDRLVSDLRSQQTKSMTGYGAESFGLHFENSSYTLFTGSYGTENYIVSLDPSLTFTGVTFPGSEIIFEAGSGDLMDATGSASISNSLTDEVKTLKINKYGATE